MTISPLFLLGILIGPILIIVGAILFYFPPKKINWWYGHRTKNSMKNEERWDFSQIYAAKLMILIGFLYSLITCLLSLAHFNEQSELIIGILLMIGMFVFLLIRVETKLKQKFK